MAQSAGSFRPPGDLSGDLQVTVSDAILGLQMISGLRNFTQADRDVMDVAPTPGTGTRLWGDGLITVADVIRLLRRAAGAEPDPWPGGPVVASITKETTFALTQATGPFAFTLTDGIQVTGTLLDEKNQPLSTTLYYWNATQRLLGSVVTDAQGKFTIQVPQGLYNFSTITTVTDSTKGATVEVAQPDLASVPVQPGMGSLTLKRKALPALVTVTGSMSLATLPTTMTPTRVVFLDEERRYEFAPPPTFATGTVGKDGKFTLILPVGTFKPLLDLDLKDKDKKVIGSVTTLPPQSGIIVNGNRSFTLSLPDLGSLSGNISLTGALAPLASGRVRAVEVQRTQREGAAMGRILIGQFQIPLQSGMTYRLGFLPNLLNPAPQTDFGLGFVPSDVSVIGNKTQSYVLPTAPAIHPLSLWIGDSLGRPIPNARLHLVSQTINNANSGWLEETDVTASAQGLAVVNLPDGSYDLILQPALPSVVEVTQF